jgi:anaerobic magnesium-protoporphyrin IX monomethyl ester cyclase
MIELCNEIIERKLTIEWCFLGLARHFVRDTDIFPLMRKAGCFQVLLGIEVSSDEELKWLHKGITVNDIKTAIRGLRENDIATVGTWMVGLWDDDEKAIKERFAFVDEADPDFAALGVFHPNVGSPFWREYTKLGAIEETDLRYWDAHHPVRSHRGDGPEILGRPSSSLSDQIPFQRRAGETNGLGP